MTDTTYIILLSGFKKGPDGKLSACERPRIMATEYRAVSAAMTMAKHHDGVAVWTVEARPRLIFQRGIIPHFLELPSEGVVYVEPPPLKRRQRLGANVN